MPLKAGRFCPITTGFTGYNRSGSSREGALVLLFTTSGASKWTNPARSRKPLVPPQAPQPGGSPSSPRDPEKYFRRMRPIGKANQPPVRPVRFRLDIPVEGSGRGNRHDPNSTPSGPNPDRSTWTRTQDPRQTLQDRPGRVEDPRKRVGLAPEVSERGGFLPTIKTPGAGRKRRNLWGRDPEK